MSTPTQKQALEQAEATIKDLETKVEASKGLQGQLDTATTNLKAAEKLAGEETARANKAETDLKAATAKLGAAEKLAGDEKARADKLEGESRTTEEKAREQNSRLGLNSHKKDDAQITGAGEDIAAIAAKITDPSTSMTEKAALVAKHGAALNAYAAKEQAKG